MVVDFALEIRKYIVLVISFSAPNSSCQQGMGRGFCILSLQMFWRVLPCKLEELSPGAGLEGGVGGPQSSICQAARCLSGEGKPEMLQKRTCSYCRRWWGCSVVVWGQCVESCREPLIKTGLLRGPPTVITPVQGPACVVKHARKKYKPCFLTMKLGLVCSDISTLLPRQGNFSQPVCI